MLWGEQGLLHCFASAFKEAHATEHKALSTVGVMCVEPMNPSQTYIWLDDRSQWLTVL